MKLFFRSRRPAFTLIELMVVIVIIIVITLAAVGSYGGVQKQARLDFAADSLVSIIKEQIQFSRSGTRFMAENANLDSSSLEQVSGQSNLGKLQCFALKFEVNADSQAIEAGQSFYNAVGSEAKGEAGKVDFCDVLATEQWLAKDFLGEGLTLKMIRQKSTALGNLGGGEVQEVAESMEFYFKPPFGKVYRRTADGFRSVEDQVYYFELGYQDANLKQDSVSVEPSKPFSDQNSRVIEYNVQSKTVRRV